MFLCIITPYFVPTNIVALEETEVHILKICLHACQKLSDFTMRRILNETALRASKNVNICLTSNIYSDLETSGGQSSYYI